MKIKIKLVFSWKQCDRFHAGSQLWFLYHPIQEEVVRVAQGKKEHMYTHYSHLITSWAAEVIYIIICMDLDTGMGKYWSYHCFLRELQRLRKAELCTLAICFLKLQSTVFRFVFLSSKSPKYTYFESFPDFSISGNINTWNKCYCHSFASLF